ncbi:MAG: D-alanyl-D-alanine carboxypeptidase family protein, partial [Pseudomonadota bacterium]|nr:D-alanyl-D-alanine carboxypeptidase family protein [Pseudomonadota bacterium]
MKRLVLLIVSALVFASHAAAQQSLVPAPPAISASGYLLMDADSGEVLIEHNADERLPPASLTKLMTSYVLSYELEQGQVSNSDLVTISKNAWAQNPIFTGSSLMWIEVGKQVTLGDLHKGVVISSGNDASVAVAEYLAGSEDAFAGIMNQHAQMLGLENTHFVNSHGLPHPEHYTSARDLAILARAIIDFPNEYALYSEKEFVYNNIRQNNRNGLLWTDPSVDGLKTGHTNEAGYCLVTSAKREGMRLISVVMGASSERVRERETQKLLSYGFRYFETHHLYSAGTELTKAKVWKGSSADVALGVQDDVYLTIPRGKADDLDAQLIVNEVLTA